MVLVAGVIGVTGSGGVMVVVVMVRAIFSARRWELRRISSMGAFVVRSLEVGSQNLEVGFKTGMRRLFAMHEERVFVHADGLCSRAREFIEALFWLRAQCVWTERLRFCCSIK